MSDSDLDQLVKGAPPPEKHFDIPTSGVTDIDLISSSGPLSDPLASLPSSPPQIYLNLLILEASLRAQYLQLRARRRQHTFFLTLLGLWIIYFGYALFFAPREDGNGVGGSVYWVVEVTEKVCFMGGIVTGILIWATGQWERGIRWPRRWLFRTNRGLVLFNVKAVLLKRPWWRETLSILAFLFSSGLFGKASGTTYRYVDHSLLVDAEKRGVGVAASKDINEDDGKRKTGCEEDLSPGGDYIKIHLLPKYFKAPFRENWDMYRAEYWEKENERRVVLRSKMKQHDRKIAKAQGGWLWWTGYRGWNRRKSADIEKMHHNVYRQGIEAGHKRTRSSAATALMGGHSRSSSRASTPTTETEETATGHVRKSSTVSNPSRKKKAAAGTRVAKLTKCATPDVQSPLARQNSFTSISSMDSEKTGTTAEDGDSIRSLKHTRNVSTRATKLS